MQPHRRHGWRRVAPLALLGAAALALSSCAKNAPQDSFKPEGPYAKGTDNLAKPVFITAVIIGLFVYALIAFQDRGDAGPCASRREDGGREPVEES